MCALISSRPSSNTWNRPTGPAPTMTASVSIGPSWLRAVSATSGFRFGSMAKLLRQSCRSSVQRISSDSLSFLSFHSSASGGAGLRLVMLGQPRDSSALSLMKCSWSLRHVFLGQDGVDRALGDAHRAVDAFVGVDASACSAPRGSNRRGRHPRSRCTCSGCTIRGRRGSWAARAGSWVGWARAPPAVPGQAAAAVCGDKPAILRRHGGSTAAGCLLGPPRSWSRAHGDRAAAPTVTTVGRPACSTVAWARRVDPVLADQLVAPAGARDHAHRRVGRPAGGQQAPRQARPAACRPCRRPRCRRCAWRAVRRPASSRC